MSVTGCSIIIILEEENAKGDFAGVKEQRCITTRDKDRLLSYLIIKYFLVNLFACILGRAGDRSQRSCYQHRIWAHWSAQTQSQVLAESPDPSAGWPLKGGCKYMQILC